MYVSNIQKIKNENGEIKENDQDILKECTKFYSELYKANDNINDQNIDLFTNYANSVRLNENDKLILDRLLDEAECKKTLNSMPNNKSPGSDGLPCEFYKKFWENLKTYLISALNYSLEIGFMSTSQQRSVITLLPKKRKDSELLKSWRPISLLNTDYKIATKAIALRIKTIIGNLIHSDQTGFIKGRYIGENIRRLLDTIDYCNVHEIPSLYMFIDFEKAFDRLEWSFIDRTLSYFNFGETIRKWVQCFYKNASASVCNNGWLSDTFYITRGVRQGCPLSPYLFILCSEILAITIRNNEDIEGSGIKNLSICR
jgi:hypothetical protein